MTASFLELAGGIAIVVDPILGVKGKPLMVTDRQKKVTVLFNNSAEYAVFVDSMLEFGVTFDDLSLKKQP